MMFPQGNVSSATKNPVFGGGVFPWEVVVFFRKGVGRFLVSRAWR